MSGSWQQRVGHASGTYHLQAAQNAARNLADQAGSIFPDKGRLVFQTVTDVAILATIVLSGTLAAVHLWKALSTKPNEQGPKPVGGGRVPPRRPVTYTAASADGASGRRYEDDEARSR